MTLKKKKDTKLGTWHRVSINASHLLGMAMTWSHQEAILILLSHYHPLQP